MSVTILLSRNSITHVKEYDIEKLKNIFGEIKLEFKNYNTLCKYVSKISLKEDLSYKLLEKCNNQSTHTANVYDIIFQIEKVIYKTLVKESRKLSGHEVTSRNHIRTNPGGKVFSRPMDKWGKIKASIDETKLNETYQEMTDRIANEVEKQFKGKDVVLKN